MLPRQGWWLYAVLLTVGLAWVTVIRWVTHVAPVGDVSVAALAPVPYGLVAIAMIQYLDRIADRALRTFAPAMDTDSESTDFWRRELTTLSRRSAAVVALAGAAFGVLVLVQTPESVARLYAGDVPTTILLTGWVVVSGFAATGLLLYHTWHQLRVIAAVHAAATRIDPFEPKPLFAFSRLTARTGLAYVFILYYTLTVNGELSSSEQVILLGDAAVGIGALACFVLPLVGMHRRLGAAKEDLLARSNRGIKDVSGQLYARLAQGDLTEMESVEAAMTSLGRVREVVAGLPTWPWTPGLLRGFLTAVFLPIVIWLITRLLTSVFAI
jgi:hypothetical protein